jgi:hypothetical protein
MGGRRAWRAISARARDAPASPACSEIRFVACLDGERRRDEYQIRYAGLTVDRILRRILIGLRAELRPERRSSRQSRWTTPGEIERSTRTSERPRASGGGADRRGWVTSGLRGLLDGRRAIRATLCFVQITRTVMLVIHDECHSAIGEPPTEPQRTPNEGPANAGGTHALGGVSRYP